MLARLQKFFQGFLTVIFQMGLPVLAFADGSSGGDTPVAQGLTYITSAMTGTTGIALATVAVIGVGLLCLFHVLDWKTHFGGTIIGIAVIFGASSIVTHVTGLIKNS